MKVWYIDLPTVYHLARNNTFYNAGTYYQSGEQEYFLLR